MGCPWIPVRSVPPNNLLLTNTHAMYNRGSFEQVQVSPLYFDREDVKKAINAPANVTWAECSLEIFPNGDASPPSALTVLPSVIERSERSLIVQGLGDFRLIAEG